MQLIKLRDAITARAPKILVYGESGVGKTTLIGSLPGRVLIASAEAGLLSLSFASGDDRYDVVEICTVDDLLDVHRLLSSGRHSYDWVCLDSLSEIAEVFLGDAKKKVSDPRQAYAALAERMTAAIRAFRNLPIGVYFSAKQSRIKDEVSGRITYGISMPGSKLGDAIPYLFDEVFRLVVVDEVAPDGKRSSTRYLQTSGDVRCVAKDRSGVLAPLEPADLGAIVARMSAGCGSSSSTTTSTTEDTTHTQKKEVKDEQQHH